MKRSEIVAEARRYVEAKTPWRSFGRSERGLDCGGLPAVVANHFGIPVDQYDGSLTNPDGQQLVRILNKALIEVHPPLKLGMVVLLQNMGSPLHLGIIGELYGARSIIHVGANRRVTCEETFTRELEKHIYMTFDFPGVED